MSMRKLQRINRNRIRDNLLFLLLCFSFGTYAGVDEELAAAREAVRSGKLQQAKTLYSKLLKEHPDAYKRREFLIGLADVSQKLGDCAEAASRYVQLIRDYPHSAYLPKAYLGAGVCYYQMKLYEKSLAYLLKATKKNHGQQKVNALCHTAKTYEALREWGNAAKYFLKCGQELSLVPKHDKNLVSQAYLRAAEIEFNFLNQRKKALKHMRIALSPKKAKQFRYKFFRRKLLIENFTKKHPIPELSIADILFDKDDVYIATWTSGLFRYSRSSEEIHPVYLPSKNIRAIYRYEDTLYVASFDGIFQLNLKTGSSSTVKVNEKNIPLAQRIIRVGENLYITTLSAGLIKIDLKNGQVERYGSDSWVGATQTFSLAADKQYIVVGTLNDGAVIRNYLTGEVSRINAETGLGGNNVKALLLSGRYLWIGLHGQGVYRYDLVSKKLYRETSLGLWPTGLVQYNEYLIVATSGMGLFLYNQSTGEIRVFNAINGLRSNEIYVLKKSNDELWAGYLDQGIDVIILSEDFIRASRLRK